jgi:hypothetical protein
MTKPKAKNYYDYVGRLSRLECPFPHGIGLDLALEIMDRYLYSKNMGTWEASDETLETMLKEMDDLFLKMQRERK